MNRHEDRTINLDEAIRRDLEVFKRVLSTNTLVHRRLYTLLEAGNVKPSDDDGLAAIAKDNMLLEARISELSGMLAR
jgi:hypothetical protein